MKRYLIYCSIFFLLIAGMLFCIEMSTRHIPNSYQLKSSWMEENAETVEVLILGSSHAYMGIDPACFDKKTYNLANVSQTYEYDLLVLEKYIDKTQSLKYIILPVSYHSLFFNLMNGEEWWREIYYSVYMDCSYYPFFSKYNFEIGNLRNSWTKHLDYYIKKKDMVQTSSLGLSQAYTVENRWPDWDEGNGRAQAHTKYTENQENFLLNKAILNNIVELCRKKSIELLLVTMPVRSSYSESIDPQQMRIVQETIQEIVDHSPNVHYYNDFFLDVFAEDDFFDSDHFTPQGACNYAKILNKYISTLEDEKNKNDWNKVESTYELN